MPRQVFLENWQEQLEITIKTVMEMTKVHSSSYEQSALLGELRQLEEMARQVQEVAPADREAIASHAIAISIREPLQLPVELMERLGELFDIYRRFRNRLTWSI